ncbi:DUF389 domain-containing protein [Jatrophihabitans sp. YIM 134969]
MTVVRLRLVCLPDATASALAVLQASPGLASMTVHPGGAVIPRGDVVTADLARESLDAVVAGLHRHGCVDRGELSWEPVETAVGALVRDAEIRAPGEGVDALVWEELAARTDEDSRLSRTYLAFMVAATVLAAIGVVTDSVVAVVGAMVVGPDFGPLAGLAVATVRRDARAARRSGVAVVVGFVVAIVVTAAFVLALRALGLADVGDVRTSDQTEFVYHPGWLSLVTALVAGVVGMVALTSGRSATLLGVFISVTTIPAAGYIATAPVFGFWSAAAGSLGQLGLNLVGIEVAALAVLWARSRSARAPRGT